MKLKAPSLVLHLGSNRNEFRSCSRTPTGQG